MSRTLFFSVGEPSGDQHAARLIPALQRHSPDLQLRGFGGPKMRAAGCRLDLELTQHAVVGLVEVLPKLRQFFGFADQAEAQFAAGNVDAVLLVDFPGFNWHIAKRAKKFGIPVYYYCPPQLWAWGGWRIGKLRRTVDHVLCVLPIEKDYYDRHGVSCTLVGHPFFDAVAESKLDTATLRQLGHDRHSTKRQSKVCAVLPGSRGGEVEKNWPVMLNSMRRLAPENPGIRFVVACHRDRLAVRCREAMRDTDTKLPIEFYVGRTSEVIEAARCAMMVSGSVSLEMMARRTPASVLYRVSRSLHMIARHMVKLDSITLPNLLAGRRILPEMVSVGGTEPAVDFLYRSVSAMLRDDFYHRQLLSELDTLRMTHARPGASETAADWLAGRLADPDETARETYLPHAGGGPIKVFAAEPKPRRRRAA